MKCTIGIFSRQVLFLITKPNFIFFNPGIHILYVEQDSPAILDARQFPGPEHFSDSPNTSPEIEGAFLDGIQPFGNPAHRMWYPLRLCKPLFFQTLFRHRGLASVPELCP